MTIYRKTMHNRSGLELEFLHPKAGPENLGYIPEFLDVLDDRSAKEQFNSNYISGWRPFNGFKLREDNALLYPNDPPIIPIAQTMLRDELIVFYQSSWVAIIQKDRSFEVCRMD